jgi:vitamin B12 transporter
MQSNKQVLVLATLAASISTVFAAEITELPTTVVTAARLAQAEREVVGDVTVISAEELEQEHGKTLTEVLAKQPGIQMSSNGGVGKAMSLFLRGANSTQTVVLIDGMRYGSATSGGAALQHIPVEQIERIEILRGPAASLYGSDAIGGVIQIFTRRGGDKPQASIEFAEGSHATRQANANYSATHAGNRIAIGISHEKTDGISAVRNPTYSGYFNPDNDGYENTSVSLSASRELAKGHEIGFSGLGARVHNQYDGYTTTPYDMRDKGENGAASVWSKNRFTQNWQSELRAGYSEDDSYNIVSTGTSRFRTRQKQASWLNNLDIGNDTATLGAETLRQQVSGTTSYTVDHRDIDSLLGGYLWRLKSWTLQANARHDRNSQFGSKNSGQIGANWQMDKSWQLGGNLGTGFRAPSFNELYYPGYGKAGLKPEESVNREVFARFEQGAWQGSFTVYRNTVTDLIQYDSSIWAPNNIGRVTLQGTTLTGAWQGKTVNAGASWDWLDARDSSGSGTDGKWLTRRAKNSGTAYAGAKFGAFDARAEVKAQSRRFENAANTQTMGGYALVNLAAGWQADKNWRVEAKLNNVLDKEYEIARNYNTDGINGMLLMRWSL